MKKFFSLIAAVLFAGSMMAQVTITPGDFTETTSADYSTVKEGVTVAVAASTVTSDQIRIFKNQTITISAASNITSIVFTCTANGTTKYGPGCFNAQDGYTFDPNGNTGTWAGSATSVTFTAESNQVRATQIVVTLEGGEVPPVSLDTFTVAGSIASAFGTAWDASNADNDMVLAGGIYKWQKEVTLNLGILEFKVAKNHSWDVAYPTSNYVLNIAEDGDYSLTITFDPATETVDAQLVFHEPIAEPTDCATAAAAAMSVSANNELYNDGATYTIEGYVTSIKTAYNDQYHNISFWMADTQDGGEVLQAYRAACASEEDAPAVGDKVKVIGQLTKYGSTPEFAAGCTFMILEHAVVTDYYLVGSFNGWTANADYKFVANAENAGEYMLENVALSAEDSIKVIGVIGETTTWYPDNAPNYVIEVDSLYNIYFRPDGQGGEDWYYNCLFVAVVEPLAAPTNCVEAAAAAMSVSANNEPYNDGAVYTIEGYVTGIKTAYSDQYHNITFWMADTQDGGEVLQAYHAACASEEEAPVVGDKVAVTGSLTKYYSTPEFAAGCTFVILKDEPVEEVETIYDWAAEVGISILNGAEAANVKIHTNTDEVPSVKFSSSANRLAIKPAEGGFMAGDEISVAVVFNNNDDTKYCMVDFFAADGTTRLWRTDSASTINGRTSAAEPIVQTYILETDQDSLLLARHGNTAMYVTLLNVVRKGGVVPPTPQLEDGYYLVGSFNGWAADEAYQFKANPEAEGEYMLEGIVLHIADELKVIGISGETSTWYPGEGDNYVINEDAEYVIYFRPDYQGGDDWHYNCIYAAKVIYPAAIDNTDAEIKAVKMIENGKLVIIKNGVRYDATGIRF